MPVRSILFANRENDEIFKERKNRIHAAIQRKDFSFIEANLYMELDHGHEELVHDGIVDIVNEISETCRQRAKYEPLMTKDKNGEPAISNAALYPIFPRDRLCALRDHPAIQLEVCGETNIQTFCLANLTREEGLKYEQDHLLLISTVGGSMKLYGPKDLLDILQVLLLQKTNEFWDEFSEGVLIPYDLHLWEAQKFEILNAFTSLKEDETRFKDLLDHLVCRLYGFHPASKDEAIQQFSKEAIGLIRGAAQAP